ncbi:MAG: class I SAM-dependent methyltransferase [Deltaproteobacteria bacterium]|nr:MAG: class I SAM-dependent methyltransferase [Deltaproteobacteria bacterium]
MRGTGFTGERLHEGAELFRVDLARHKAAYRFAAERAASARVLDLGCGSGYGTAELAKAASSAIGVDRVSPDSSACRGVARYVRSDLNHLSLAPACFDLIVSFQVIEHLRDPTEYLKGIGRLLAAGGTALITTPNRLTSDGENPYHVHEYLADELAECLSGHFHKVEMRGVGASPPVARYLDARLRHIRRITRLDPLRLRRRIPRGLAEWLFARFAVLVRRGIQAGEGLPEVSWRDFPIGPVDDACIDLLAICREPIPPSTA